MKKTLTLSVLAVIGLFFATSQKAEAAAFTFDVGLGYAAFSSEVAATGETPSGFTGRLGFGAHFDRRWSIQADLGGHSYSDEIGGYDLTLSNNFFEVTSRYYFGDVDKTVRFYAGGGLSLLTTSYEFERPYLGGVLKYDDSGSALGLIALGGVEFGNERHAGFVEAGYRFYFTEPFDGADGSDYNNLPIQVGYRLKL